MAEPIYNDSGCTGSAPLVMGAARGRRAFYLDELGVLRGMTYRWAWRDGENVAQCMVTAVRQVGVRGVRGMYPGIVGPYTMGGVTFPADPDGEPVPAEGMKWARCEGLESTCGCGFYAYHDGASMYAASGPGCRVQGVVEAYGKVVLGTQGYRAEKARILAIVVPPTTEASNRRRELDKAIEDINNAIKLVDAAVAAPWWKQTLILAYLGLTVAAVAAALVHAPWRAGGLLLAGYALANARISHITIQKQLKSMQESLREDLEHARLARAGLPHDYSLHVERAKERYPSVKFYENAQDMMRDFPVESLRHLAIPEGPVPNDAGD